MALGGLCAAYIRLWPHFQLAVRLYRRWGTGWEVFFPCIFPCNVFIPIVFHFATKGSNLSALSIVTHIAVPATNLLLCLSPIVLRWTARLGLADMIQSMVSFFAFMYLTLWYYQLTHRSWPYTLDGDRVPDLFTLVGNAAMGLTGITLLLLGLMHRTFATWFVHSTATMTNTAPNP